jgi:DNA mismatch endonuclease (patch repair protein)
MPEAWVSTTAGRHLSGRKKENTQPEILLRKALHAAGYRFRVHRQLATGCTPDIVLPKFRLAIFVDGCFWHGCPVHGRTSFSGPNAQLWADKMTRNRLRDQLSTSLAEQGGWHVLRVWECLVRSDVGEAVSLVASSTQEAGFSPL